MKKIFILLIGIFVAQVSFAKNITPHIIYFPGGDVRPHQYNTFSYPNEKLMAGVSYDLSCDINSPQITVKKPIIYVKDPSISYSDHTLFNDSKTRYPFQARLVSNANTLVLQNYSCVSNNGVSCDKDSGLLVYNFDDTETVTFSNCFFKVSKNNA